ncbi:MAG: DUF167 domain-containing protein [Candidatus Peribacteraceae bacterium]|nr:DUF167 domain-containing protein [Candidatus Peribacteraceae bacterium]
MFDALIAELHARGSVCFSVRVRPGAPKTVALSSLVDGSIKVAVAAPPEKGKANKELIKYIAQQFGVPCARVSIISGAADRHKLVQVRS